MGMDRKAALRIIFAAGLAGALAACNSGGANGNVPGNTDSTEPFAEIAPGDTLRFTGTEPFWGGEATGTALLYTTPEKPEGETVTVKRFAGRGGMSLSGELGGQPFDMAVAMGECSDGMSDRTYPFAVTLSVKGEMRSGCAWTEKHPFSGDEHP